MLDAVKSGASNTGVRLHSPLFSVDVVDGLILVYYGFTKQYMDDAVSGKNPGGVRRFCFVALENASIPKFGLDENENQNKDDLDDLSWDDFDVNGTSGYLKISTIQSRLNSITFSSPNVNREFKNAANMAVITLNKPAGLIMDFSRCCSAELFISQQLYRRVDA